MLFARSAGPVSPARLDVMVDALTHRGPDDRGVWSEGGIGVGMRRLSIVDLSGGHQPMISDDGSVVIVYNGECYNHNDLRRELEAAGHKFKTTCDTEAALHGYMEWGVRGVAERMNGIYAFCIWDKRLKKAFIVRDRLGVKPLYFIDRNGRFAFSSELRSAAMSGLVHARIDEQALWGYLGYQFTPTERTLVNGVHKLPAAHYLEWSDGAVSMHKYWEFPNQAPDAGADRQERTEALRELLWDVVDRQMMADVPIGCFLSGGLDSTIIACMMAQRSNHAVRTFSIAFPGVEDCDESTYFERMSKHIGANHMTIDFSEKQVIEQLTEFSWAMDEPVADPAMLPTYLLSKAAGAELKVVLTGEGADEVFAGYPYYRRFTEGMPRVTPRQSAERLHHRLLAARAMSERVGTALTAPRNDLSSAISGFPYALDARFIWNLLQPDRRPALERLEAYQPNLERAALADLTAVQPLQAALALDTKLWLGNDLMPKLDKMTMAHSLEGRVPFLDHRLIEFAFTLPDAFKIGPEHGKMILRDAVRGIIPDWMLFRVKHGFNVPLYEWFKNSLKDFVRESLLGSTLRDTGLFNPHALEALFTAHTELDINVARPLWELICLSRWYERLQGELRFADRCAESETITLDPPAEYGTKATVAGVCGSSALNSAVARDPIRGGTARPAVTALKAGDGIAAASPRVEKKERAHHNGNGSNGHTPTNASTQSSDRVMDGELDAPVGMHDREGVVAGRCDLIVPIYEGVNYVLDLLRSICRHTKYPYRVLLIDDSANEQTYAALCDAAKDQPNVELYRNDENLGFIGTCNRGIEIGRSQYVCLLNSDTIVTEGWLERMIRCAEHDPRIAIVNPLSNMCVNLSVVMPPGLNLNTMARRVAELSRRTYPDITTAVGFCMLMKRRYIDWLGAFDPVYGRGYCEESDLCMRYTESGLRVVMADDAFVYHKGCGSFGTWLERYKINRRIFDQRWEEAYLRDYAHFLERNPMQYMRDALLRHTIPVEKWQDDAVSIAERQSRRMVSRRVPNGPAQQRALLSAGLRQSERVRVSDPTGTAAIPRTELDPEKRHVRYPTAEYLRRLPTTDGMKITFLVASMPVAGGITSIVQLAREMLIAGHDVKIVTETHELQPERFNLPSQPLVFANRAELIQNFPQSDIVVATYWTTAEDYLDALHARYDFTSVYFIQDYEVYFYPEDDIATRARVAATYSKADYRIVKSHWLKNLIESNHGTPCEWVRLGLDLGIFRDRHGIAPADRAPRILSVARPGDRRRGFPELVRTFAQIHSVRPDVQFVLYGTLQQDMPAELPFPYENMERIYDLNKVAELVSSCDVVVDSSLFQGFGRPGLEAMACGTLCALTNEGGVNEYARDEHNCLMVRPGLARPMTDAVLRLLEDVELGRHLRTSGFATASQYCHIREAQQHMQLYERWIEAFHGGGETGRRLEQRSGAAAALS